MILLDAIPRYGLLISNFFLLVFFLWVYPNVDAKIGIYYGLMALANIVIGFIVFMKVKDLQVVWGYKGVMLSVVSVAAGIGIFMIMILMQGRTTNAILGVPRLYAISGLAETIGATQIATLGFVENRFWFGLINLMLFIFPIIPFIVLIPLWQILPYTLGAFIFSMFHLNAYGLALGSLVWAFVVFSLWAFTNYGLRLGEQPSSISHYLWNGFTVLKRSYAIVGGGS